MVEMILDRFPDAILDKNREKKNLLAAEYRQAYVCELLLRRNLKKEVFRKTDNDGNSTLHLAATLRDYQHWSIPYAALQMQWEIKWYEYVKKLMLRFNFRNTYNARAETAQEIFTKSHSQLVRVSGEWLTRTSESWSAVAVLIATVAFATSATIPGGVKQESGVPTLENHPIFRIFAISYPIALCFSAMSIIMFLAIRTSMYDKIIPRRSLPFSWSLPFKLLLGITSLFVSMAAMLVSFFAGHFFVLKDKRQYAAFSAYAFRILACGVFRHHAMSLVLYCCLDHFR